MVEVDDHPLKYKSTDFFNLALIKLSITDEKDININKHLKWSGTTITTQDKQSSIINFLDNIVIKKN